VSLREELAAPRPERLPLPDALAEAHRRAGLARVMLLVYAGVVAFLLLGSAVVGFLFPAQVEAWAAPFDRIALPVSVGLFIACAVTFVRWKLTAYRLLPDLTGSDTNHTPSWAGWAYFVPFLNFVRPYGIMRELWEGSEPEHLGVDLEHEPVGTWPLGVWWGCWLLGGFADRVSRSLERNGASPDDGTLIFMDISSAVLLVVAAACAAFLVGRIDDRAQRRGTEVLARAVHPLGPPALRF